MSSPNDDFQTGTLFPENDPLIDEPATITSGNNNTIIGINNDGITFSPTAPPMPEYLPDELPFGGRPDEDPGQWYSPYDEGNSTGYVWTVVEEGPTETYRSGVNLGAVFIFVIFGVLVAVAAFLFCARLVHQTQNRTMMNHSKNRKHKRAINVVGATEEHLKTFHHLQVPHGSDPGSVSTGATYPTSYAETFAASSGAGGDGGGGLIGAFVVGGGGGGCDAGGGAACGM